MVLSVWGQNPPVLWLYITAEGLQGYSLSLSKVNVPWAGLFNLLHHPGRGPPPLLAYSAGPPPCLLTVLAPPPCLLSVCQHTSPASNGAQERIPCLCLRCGAAPLGGIVEASASSGGATTYVNE